MGFLSSYDVHQAGKWTTGAPQRPVVTPAPPKKVLWPPPGPFRCPKPYGALLEAIGPGKPDRGCPKAWESGEKKVATRKSWAASFEARLAPAPSISLPPLKFSCQVIMLLTLRPLQARSAALRGQTLTTGHRVSPPALAGPLPASRTPLGRWFGARRRGRGVTAGGLPLPTPSPSDSRPTPAPPPPCRLATQPPCLARVSTAAIAAMSRCRGRGEAPAACGRAPPAGWGAPN